MEKIYGFFGEHRFLSNFWAAPVMYDGMLFPNNEAAFQAAKCIEPADREPFTAMPPNEAKRAGRRVALRPDWEDVKLAVMEAVVRDKFSRNPTLGRKLLATGDKELVEANSWHDVFWGVDEKTDEGRNELGKILMRIRTELQA